MTNTVHLGTGVTVTMDRPVQSQAEFVEEASRRFGDDPMGWAFVCPHCGDVATGQDFADALAGTDRPASRYLGRECIGRVLGALSAARLEEWAGRGCDWAAYGLLGTLGKGQLVDTDAGVMDAFAFAAVTA